MGWAGHPARRGVHQGHHGAQHGPRGGDDHHHKDEQRLGGCAIRRTAAPARRRPGAMATMSTMAQKPNAPPPPRPAGGTGRGAESGASRSNCLVEKVWSRAMPNRSGNPVQGWVPWVSSRRQTCAAADPAHEPVAPLRRVHPAQFYPPGVWRVRGALFSVALWWS